MAIAIVWGMSWGHPTNVMGQNCVVSPDTIRFGTVVLGESATASFEIKNTDFSFPPVGLQVSLSECCNDFGICGVDCSSTISTCFTPLDMIISALSGPEIIEVKFEPTIVGEQVCEIDLGNPLCPKVVVIGSGCAAATTLDARDVAIGGNRLYGVRDSRLDVFDITNPNYPVPLNSVPFCGTGRDVVLDGDYAYVAAREGGLSVIDVSIPGSELRVATLDLPGLAYGVVVEGNVAYIAAHTAGLVSVDISDPKNPVFLDAHNTPGLSWGVAVAGDRAYVADDASGVRVVDVGNPALMVPFGSVATLDLAFGLAVAGNRLYVADASAGVTVVDITDPSNPSVVANLNTPGVAERLTVNGNTLRLADGAGGVHEIDITDPDNPALVQSRHADVALGVDTAGKVAYIADAPTGFRTVTVAAPILSPTIAGSVGTPTSAREVAVAGDVLYLADESSLEVFDITDPGNPTLLVSHGFVGEGRDVAVSGDFLFAAARSGGVHVFDVSNPALPSLVGGIAPSGLAYGLEVVGNVAYVAAHTAGLHAIDITDPTMPALLDSYDTPGLAWQVAVDGDRAYVADDASGVQVIDISDPTDLKGADNWSAVATAFGVAVSGNYVYVARDGDGVSIVEKVGPIGVPRVLTEIDTPGAAEKPVIDGDMLYLADGAAGLQMIDVTNPAAPSIVGNYDTDLAIGVAVSGEHAFVADGASGLKVVNVCESPAATAVRSGFDYAFGVDQNFPNPFNPSTTIRYTVGTAGGQVTLSVYDVTGRLVRTLVNELRTPGQKHAVWDGRDEHGQRVSTGVYFYRLQAPGFEQTRKMVLLK
jgi:hypothetical protein